VEDQFWVSTAGDAAGLPIRDVSPGDTGGMFLNAERNLLRDQGWQFNGQTNYWMPPGM
jgi:hypothetical protein